MCKEIEGSIKILQLRNPLLWGWLRSFLERNMLNVMFVRFTFLLHIAVVCSFSLLCLFPLYKYTTIYPLCLMDIGVVFTFWLL